MNLIAQLWSPMRNVWNRPSYRRPHVCKSYPSADLASAVEPVKPRCDQHLHRETKRDG